VSTTNCGRLSLASNWQERVNLPAYLAREVANIAGVSPQTVSGWFYGYPHSEGERGIPVFREGKRRRVALSYLQLVEVAYVATCRKQGISLKRIKRARAYLAQAFKVEHPFADLQMLTAGPHILAEMGVDELVVADRFGQIGWKSFMLERIAEFEFDQESSLALRWFPRGRRVPVLVDPRINFGRPILARSGVATWAVADALRSGEDPDDIKLDFGVDDEEIIAAEAFEKLKAA